MKLPVALSQVLVLAAACGCAGANEPTVSIVSVNGTISRAGQSLVPTYGVAGSGKSGRSVGVILSDAPMGCDALTADYTSSNMPAVGTYVATAFPSFEKGVNEKTYVQFMVISKSGGMSSKGSNAGTVEVVDVTDSAVTIGIEYQATLSDGDYVVSGQFTVTRCPAVEPIK